MNILNNCVYVFNRFVDIVLNLGVCRNILILVDDKRSSLIVLVGGYFLNRFKK